MWFLTISYFLAVIAYKNTSSREKFVNSVYIQNTYQSEFYKSPNVASFVIERTNISLKLRTVLLLHQDMHYYDGLDLLLVWVHFDLSILHILASTHASIKIFMAKNIASKLLQKVCALFSNIETTISPYFLCISCTST